ncbi:metallophosphoesterase [Staphylospora marina]|uniref:metallophosphoesterase n=1 Tax=Staphylospora marina TaxID=2490858 RepID=UPI000F5B928D|nr:metallophosphoesterase [Staphylospora marina]
MWGLIITVFMLLYSLMCYYIGRRGWNTFVKTASRGTRILFVTGFCLLVLPFPLAEIGEDVLPPAVVPWLTILGGYTMVAVLYGCLLLLVLDVLRLIDRKAGFLPAAVKEHQKAPLIAAIVLFAVVVGTVVYGGLNARNPVVTKYEVTVNKDAGPFRELKVAMVSDIHFGPIIQVRRLERLHEIIRGIKPDIVLLAGDITDGSLPPGEAGKLAEALGRINVPYGVYAVPGNHDRDLRDHDSELMQKLNEAGIQVLKDRHVNVKGGFTLIGRDDPNRRSVPARMPLKDLMNGIDPSKPLILLDHQPIDLEESRAHGIDLQLSGHTHKGQIFPAGLITGMIYETDWGLLKKGSHHLIVSCGFGTWGPPLRIGNRPEVVQITMKFK